MKILYINLDEALERKAWMERQARSLGLEFTRQKAIEAQDVSDEDAAKLKLLDETPNVNRHAVAALARSHMECWKSILDFSDKYACILEDDAVLSESSVKFFCDDQWIPDDADIIKVETVFQRISETTPHPQTGREMMPDRRFCLRKLEQRHFGTAGYIISRGACERLLKLEDVDLTHIDLRLFCPYCRVTKNLVIYQLDPAICVQQQILDVRKEFRRWSHLFTVANQSYVFTKSVKAMPRRDKISFRKRVNRSIGRLRNSSGRLITNGMMLMRPPHERPWQVGFDCNPRAPWFASTDSR